MEAENLSGGIEELGAGKKERPAKARGGEIWAGGGERVRAQRKGIIDKIPKTIDGYLLMSGLNVFAKEMTY